MSQQNIKATITINGQAIYFSSTKELLKSLLFFLIDIDHSPIDALIENTRQIFSFVLEYCKEEKMSSAGILIRSKGILQSRKQDIFVKKFYDLILSLDNLSALPGFGTCNSFGDKIYRNPEKIRITDEKK